MNSTVACWLTGTKGVSTQKGWNKESGLGYLSLHDKYGGGDVSLHVDREGLNMMLVKLRELKREMKEGVKSDE